MTLSDFVARWKDEKLNYFPADSYQCVDLADEWAQNLGWPLPPVGFADTFDAITVPGWEWVANTPTGVPQAGDLVVWGPAIDPPGQPPAGHIAVFLSGDASGFVSFDQNWPLGSPCHVQAHDYTGVVGWMTCPNPTGGDNQVPIDPNDPVIAAILDRLKALETDAANTDHALGNFAADLIHRGYTANETPAEPVP